MSLFLLPDTGKVLGHGAFGKVIEASIYGGGKSSKSLDTVAVKMLKGEICLVISAPCTTRKNPWHAHLHIWCSV